jgi:uncharacterized protein (DUF1778 family)
MAKPLHAKTERLEARVTKEQKELFQHAASLEGKTLSVFMVSALTNAANKVFQQDRLIQLSQRDRQAFVNDLLNPHPPNEKLKAAAQRYKQIMGK